LFIYRICRPRGVGNRFQTMWRSPRRDQIVHRQLARVRPLITKGGKLMRTLKLMQASLAAASALWSLAAGAGEISNNSPVTADPLTNPAPGNWMLDRRIYDAQGYSPLDKTNTPNVKNLESPWTFSTGVNEGHEAPPIVNNGVMFVATPQNQV